MSELTEVLNRVKRISAYDLPGPTNIMKFGGVVSAIGGLSKDPKRKVGAILLSEKGKVRAVGYNGLPFGMPDSDDLLDPAIKNHLMIHAEVNLIANAASEGVCTRGGILQVEKYPCHHCAGASIGAEIGTIITPDMYPESDFYESNLIAQYMFKMAGITVIING